jgi:hypothetical protein
MTERFRPAPHVAWVDDGERVVTLRLDALDTEPIALEGSAGDVWRALGEGASLPDVVAEVAAAYDVEPEAVHPDVLSFLEEAAGSGIVTRYDA